MDVNTSFLNGDLTKEIYMEKPEGLDAPAGKVCKIIKSLYRLSRHRNSSIRSSMVLFATMGIKSVSLTSAYTSMLLKGRWWLSASMWMICSSSGVIWR